MENKDKKDLTDFLNSVTNNGTWTKTEGGWYEKEDKKK